MAKISIFGAYVLWRFNIKMCAHQGHVQPDWLRAITCIRQLQLLFSCCHFRLCISKMSIHSLNLTKLSHIRNISVILSRAFFSVPIPFFGGVWFTPLKMKLIKTLRNNWKKSIFFTLASFYGGRWGLRKWEDEELRREFCYAANAYGQEVMTYKWEGG